MENTFKQLDQEISTFLFSMEKSGCESISVMFFTYQKFQLFSAGAVLEENKNGNIVAMNIFFKDQKFGEDCIIGKMHRLPFPKSDTKSERIGKLIHADLSGPMQENSLGGARYFLMMKDDYSHWRSLYYQIYIFIIYLSNINQRHHNV